MKGFKKKKCKSPLLKKTLKVADDWRIEKQEELDNFDRYSDEEMDSYFRESDIAIISQLMTENELDHKVICEVLCPSSEKQYAKFFANTLTDITDKGWHDALVNDFAILFRCRDYDFSYKDFREKAKPIPRWLKDNVSLLKLYFFYNHLYLYLDDLWFDVFICKDFKIDSWSEKEEEE